VNDRAVEVQVEEWASDLSRLCGQLIVGGFASTALSSSFAEALAQGRRGGAILFRRNIASLEQVAQLNASILQAAGPGPTPIIAVDQEGGRVARLGPPFFTLPPMRRLASAGDTALTEQAATQVGYELRALGFNLDFAPVMDVDSNPANPVIGDRAFGLDTETVIAHGLAFTRGLQRAGVLACAKHFPGHGDTLLDSHLDLPVVDQPLQRLQQVELAPFAAASKLVDSMMSAHVVYPALDADKPATFSSRICTDLLREQMGFDGVLFSDDLEMGAVAKHQDIEQAAVASVRAGCDVLLICKDEQAQERAHHALLRCCQSDSAFRQRCLQAARRALRMRRKAGVEPDVFARSETALQLAQRIEEAVS